ERGGVAVALTRRQGVHERRYGPADQALGFRDEEFCPRRRRAGWNGPVCAVPARRKTRPDLRRRRNHRAAISFRWERDPRLFRQRPRRGEQARPLPRRQHRRQRASERDGNGLGHRAAFGPPRHGAARLANLRRRDLARREARRQRWNRWGPEAVEPGDRKTATRLAGAWAWNLWSAVHVRWHAVHHRER